MGCKLIVKTNDDLIFTLEDYADKTVTTVALYLADVEVSGISRI